MDSLQSLPITFLEQTVLSEAVSFTHDSYDIIYLLSGRLTIAREDLSALYTSSDLCMTGRLIPYTLSPEGASPVSPHRYPPAVRGTEPGSLWNDHL